MVDHALGNAAVSGDSTHGDAVIAALDEEGLSAFQDFSLTQFRVVSPCWHMLVFLLVDGRINTAEQEKGKLLCQYTYYRLIGQSILPNIPGTFGGARDVFAL